MNQELDGIEQELAAIHGDLAAIRGILAGHDHKFTSMQWMIGVNFAATMAILLIMSFF